MGQAKIRGTREERILQARSSRQPPTPGTYVSTTIAGVGFVVDEVTIGDNKEGDGFFVSMVDELRANDMSAVADELDQDQWAALVKQYGLVRKV